MAFSRKGRAPYLVTPSRVPTIPVEVDWTHPLSLGLVACYVPGNPQGIFDLAGFGPILTVRSGSKIGPSSYGLALTSQTTSPGAFTGAIPPAWKLTTGGTIFSAFELFSTPVNGSTLFGMAYNSTGTSPFNDYLLSFNASSAPNFSYNHAGTFGSVQSPTSFGVGRHTIAAAFGCTNGTPLVVYQDAVPTINTTWVGAAPSYAGGGYLEIAGDIATTSRIINGNTAIALIYNRVLSASEVIQLDREPFCMLRPLRRPVFRKGAATPLTLASRGSARAQGRGVLLLSQALTSRGAGYSRGKGALTLTQPLTAQGAAYSRGRGALTLSLSLASHGSAFSRGRGALSLAQALASLGSARAYGKGVLSLSQALTSRGAAFSRGRDTLSLLLPFALTSRGSARSAGRGSLILSLALASRGTAFSQGRGVLTIGTTPLALVSRGIAFSHSRSVLTFPVFVQLHARGQAFSHGGFAPGAQHGTGILTLKPFVPFQNVIDIGFPQRSYPMVDPKTGLINETWYRFMQTVWLRGGGTIGR